MTGPLTDLPDEPMVQWAAFYADCLHEVHKVVSGVHITAVYNLMAGPTPAPYLKVRRLILKTFCPSSITCHSYGMSLMRYKALRKSKHVS